MEEFEQGDLVWFDPGIGYLLPGEVSDFSRAAQVVTVEAVINGKQQAFSIHNMNNIQKRHDLTVNGVDDMVNLVDLNEASLLWNIKIRYEKEIIYTFTGSILVSVNPYKMYDIYGLNMVKKYEGQILGTLPPHLFAIGSAAYSRMTKDNEDQVVVICGESGAGKTENTKLLMQYLAAVNKSPSNIITEQILEATPLLESFGNAKTVKNNNSSRFGKYLEIHFKEGVITGARTTEYLLEKSRIVTQAQDERNYHVFYELLAGLTNEEKEKYGLQVADKYFYLNQGGSCEIDGKDDAEGFRFLLSAMQVLGFTNEEQDTIFRMLASVLHLGNIYFHRKQFRHGQEGVEVGSDAEIRWVSHLLQLNLDGIFKAMTVKTTEARNERMVTPLNIDQALDARDAISKALYSCLFSWLVQRVNLMVYKGARKTTLAILDIFGFEDFKDNNFEQLCINYANETLQSYFNRYVFKLEQQEYAKEKIEWQLMSYPDNQAVLALISKKPVGIMPLLDDESNFPKATDQSFLEKCHYNHALNELYSRPRMSSMEFGIKHYAGQVWYSVDGFLDKNRDTLRSDVIELLISSKMSMISKMFQNLRDSVEANKTYSRSDGRFITMKPRAPTVSARFQDSLQTLLEIMSKCNPWFVRCIKPNSEKASMKFDIPVVLEQLRYSGMLETIRIRKLGYPIRMKYQQFVMRYRCLMMGKIPRGTSSKETCRMILERIPSYSGHFQYGTNKIFLRESLDQSLEKERVNVLISSVVKIQSQIRGYLARRRYHAILYNIIKIQSTYRAYRAKRDYNKIRNGIIKIQANFRMKRQKLEYQKIKALKNRQREAERVSIEKAKEKVVRDRDELERTSRAVAGINHLEIPAELAFILSKLEEWQCIHSNQNIVKVNSNVNSSRHRYRLPADIDYHAFTKFTNIYFRAHIWGMKREPIKTPFLAKNNENDFQDSLAIFKLILRFMNDSNLSGKKEKALADYIIQKGLSNSAMRDEILCQLCNQTFKNENSANEERGWLLIANCLSCFPPSSTLYKYLLKYVSDHGFDGYKSVTQRLLLQSEKSDPQNVRTYPPCLLEWKTNNKRCNMALEANFSDGDRKYAPIESWTTAEAFASEALRAKGLNSTFGWTVDLNDEGDEYGLNGNDYVLDLVSQMEIPSAFPANKSYFLVSADRSKHRNEKLNPYHNPERINKFELDIEESIPVPSFSNHYDSQQSHTAVAHNSREQSRRKDLSKNQRTRSLSREHLVQTDSNDNNSSSNTMLTSDPDISLSKKSKLNERYLNNQKLVSTEKIQLSETSKLNQRYVSNKLEAGRQSADSELQSKRRNIHSKKSSQQSKLSNKRSVSMQELGLASSALNDRYFSSRHDLHKTASLTGGSDSGPDQRNEVPSLSSFKEDSSSISNDKFANRTNMKSRPLPAEPGDEDLSIGLSQTNKSNAKKPHVIRPSSRSSSSSLSSEASSADHETDYPHIDGERNRKPMSEYSDKSNEQNARYQKYSGKLGAPSSSKHPPYSHTSKAYIDRSISRDSEYQLVKGSAMSDTSESPSLASHVKNIRIPSHTSELDQYLDDLFNPVLDANLDELSDARSLAASIKGGSQEDSAKSYFAGNFENRKICQFSEGLNDLLNEDFDIDSDFDALIEPNKLVHSLKGGGHNDIEQSQQRMNLSINTNLDSNRSFTPSDVSDTSRREASNQTPIPGNMPLMNIAGMTVPMVDTSQMIQQQVLHQQMIQMQQRAFLASSLQQNLEIQKQLLQQNQQLQNLLVQSSVVSPSSPLNNGSSTEALNNTPSSLPYPMSPLLQMQPISLLQTALGDTSLGLSMQNLQMTPSSTPDIMGGLDISSTPIKEIQTSSSRSQMRTSIPPPPPPPPPPPLSPSAADVYSRAKTVRIGKWRWPPPADGSPVPNSFFEFKRKKQQEKCEKNGEEEIQSVDFPEIPNMSELTISTQQTQQNQKNESKTQEKPEKFAKKEEKKHFQNVVPGSIGKLRISSEMKAKLEQLTIDQSVRSRKDGRERTAMQSRSMDDIASAGAVKKLTEQRKALLERQLLGSLRNPNDLIEQNTPINRRLGHRVESADNIHTKYAQSGAILGNYESTHAESLLKNQMNPNDRLRKSGSREIRERRDELGPYNRMAGTMTSTIQAECGDRLSYSTEHTFFDEVSTTNSVLYDESISSSTANLQRSGIKQNNEMPQSKQVKRMSVPPPPPPVNGVNSVSTSMINPTYQCLQLLNQSGPPSIAASSSYYAPSSPIMARHNRKLPPPPLGFAISHDRLSFDRIEFEESNEFLNPVEAPPPSVVTRSGQTTGDTMKTKLYQTSDASFFTYSKVHWKMNIRKEVFSPQETIDNPLILHLIFCQIVKDAHSTTCIRLTQEEKFKLQSQLQSHGINTSSIYSSSPKLQAQKSIIDFARELPTYFCRLYPVSGGRNLPNVHLLGVSHSGVRLIQRERDAMCDYLKVLDKLSLDDISEIIIPGNCTIQILLCGGGWITLFSPKAVQIKNLIEKFALEARQSRVEFVRALKDYSSGEPSLLGFRKGDIIRILKNKNLHLAKGWLFGVLETGEGGIFPCEYVVPLSSQEVLKISRRMDEVRGIMNGHTNGLRSTPNDINDRQEMKDRSRNSVSNEQNSLQDDSSLWVESKNDNFDDTKSDITQISQLNDGKFSLLQFALFNFRESLNKYDLRSKDGSIRGSIKLIENIKAKRKNKKGKGSDSADWTWSEISSLVKYSKTPIQSSLLVLSQELNKIATECFIAIMRYMGDVSMVKNQTEVDCVYTILLNCHKYPQIRDEAYCQLMKQTTSNKSAKPDSCQRGWRLFSIIAAYFDCSEMLRPYLFKYLETAAYDKRRAYHATANVCLKNLRKTFKYGGRKNVPSIEEIAAISAGRNSKRQMYRLPGGTERIINTTSTTVVNDIIEEICLMLNVRNPVEMEEFSLYCIIEGDPYTMPLNRDEYILDVTTELLKNGQLFYLIFCRSVWYYPLRLDSHLYIEVIFNQVAPDYLEGLLIVVPEEKLPEDIIPQIARIASLLHRAADMEQMPTKDEVKYLLPKPVLVMRELRPPQWVEMVQSNWNDMSALTTTEAKAQCLDILQKWPLFGSCFFAVKRIQNDSTTHPDHILALNREGVHFLDIITHETIWKHPFSEVISTRKVRAEDGTLFLDMKCGNLMVQKISRIQTDQAHEISRLIRQYIEIEQHFKSSGKDNPQDITLSRSSAIQTNH